MRKSKKFDCVQMKLEIQERLQAELAKFSGAEALRFQEKRIESDPILWEFLKKVSKAPSTPPATRGDPG